MREGAGGHGEGVWMKERGSEKTLLVFCIVQAIVI